MPKPRLLEPSAPREIDAAFERWESDGGATFVPRLRATTIASGRPKLDDMIRVLLAVASMRERPAGERAAACAHFRPSSRC